MRYFWTLFWSFLLSHMVVYVTSSMNGTGYNFTQGTVTAIFFAIIVFALGAVISSDEVTE